MRKEHKNKVSIVFTARNDNYGGNLISRIDTLIKCLVFLTNKYESGFELLIVDYNPPSDRKRLHEILRIRNNKNLKIRFIEFPEKYHKQFKNSERIKLFEYISKNMGIRRAVGDYVVSTNQDIIFSDAFIKFLTFGDLDSNSFYRTNRIDVSLNEEIFNKTPNQILSYCEKNAYLAKTQDGDVFLRPLSLQSIMANLKNVIYSIMEKSSFFLRRNAAVPKLMANGLHYFAAGDFLMMHKKNWNKVKGYTESTEGNDYIDSLVIFNAYALGIEQRIIPFEMFHIDHLMGKFGRPSMKLNKVIGIANDIIRKRKPQLLNSGSWGQKDLKLKEIIL